MVTAPKLILLDLDGTLYVGQEPIPGAVFAVQQLRESGIPLRFLTNTTTKSQAQLVAQMHGLGFELKSEELISAPGAARFELHRLQRQLGRTIRIWPVVAEAIKADFNEFDLDESAPDYIVLGDIGAAWSLALINRLFNAMYQGAELIALHKNRFWQTEAGLRADIGFFVAGLEYLCSKNARIMGKPNPEFFQSVLTSTGVAAADTLMVGDDIDTDIGGAQQMGMKGALVKTGKYREAYCAESRVKPDLVLDSIADLMAILSAQPE